jgi:hypothetical protein
MVKVDHAVDTIVTAGACGSEFTCVSVHKGQVTRRVTELALLVGVHLISRFDILVGSQEIVAGFAGYWGSIVIDLVADETEARDAMIEIGQCRLSGGEITALVVAVTGIAFFNGYARIGCADLSVQPLARADLVPNCGVTIQA